MSRRKRDWTGLLRKLEVRIIIYYSWVNCSFAYIAKPGQGAGILGEHGRRELWDNGIVLIENR